LLNKIHVDPNILPEIESKGEKDIRIEEFFIGQILRKIAKHGIRLLPPADYRDFKSKKIFIKGGVTNIFIFYFFQKCRNMGKTKETAVGTVNLIGTRENY